MRGIGEQWHPVPSRLMSKSVRRNPKELVAWTVAWMALQDGSSATIREIADIAQCGKTTATRIRAEAKAAHDLWMGRGHDRDETRTKRDTDPQQLSDVTETPGRNEDFWGTPHARALPYTTTEQLQRNEETKKLKPQPTPKKPEDQDDTLTEEAKRIWATIVELAPENESRNGKPRKPQLRVINARIREEGSDSVALVVRWIHTVGDGFWGSTNSDPGSYLRSKHFPGLLAKARNANLPAPSAARWHIDTEEDLATALANGLGAYAAELVASPWDYGIQCRKLREAATGTLQLYPADIHKAYKAQTASDRGDA